MTHPTWQTLSAAAKRGVERWPVLDQKLLMQALLDGRVVQTQTIGRTRSDKARASQPLAQRTLCSYIDSYTRALAWLDTRGALDHATAPVQRWRKDLIAGYVATEKTDATKSCQRQPFEDATKLVRLVGLYQILQILQSDADISQFQAFQRAIPRSTPPATEPLASLNDLRLLSTTLITHAEQKWQHGERGGKVAMRYMTGLQLRFLLRFGLRIGNLMSIRFDCTSVTEDRAGARQIVGHHLRKSASGQWLLEFDADQVKNWRSIRKQLSTEDYRLLQRFVTVIRPTLCLGTYGADQMPYDGDRLWVSSRGTPQTVNSAYKCLAKLAQEVLQKHVHPHVTRQALATDLIKHNANALPMVAQILENTPATAEKHYVRSDGAGAADGARALLRTPRP